MSGDAGVQHAEDIVAEVKAQNEGMPLSELWRRVLDRVETSGLDADEELALAKHCYRVLFGIELT